MDPSVFWWFRDWNLVINFQLWTVLLWICFASLPTLLPDSLFYTLLGNNIICQICMASIDVGDLELHASGRFYGPFCLFWICIVYQPTLSPAPLYSVMDPFMNLALNCELFGLIWNLLLRSLSGLFLVLRISGSFCTSNCMHKKTSWIWSLHYTGMNTKGMLP